MYFETSLYFSRIYFKTNDKIMKTFCERQHKKWGVNESHMISHSKSYAKVQCAVSSCNNYRIKFKYVTLMQTYTAYFFLHMQKINRLLWHMTTVVKSLFSEMKWTISENKLQKKINLATHSHGDKDIYCNVAPNHSFMI